ncbi:hypothetical protein D3C86_1016520 [compost metagenome]
MLQCLAGIVHGPGRDGCCVESLEPRGKRVAGQHLFNKGGEDLSVGMADFRAIKARVSFPFRMPQHVCDAFPVCLVGPSDGHPAIGTAEDLIWGDNRMSRAGWRRDDAVRKIPCGIPVELLH